MTKQPLTNLMQTEMTRQEFLLTLGLGVVSIFGLSALIGLFTGTSVDERLNNRLNTANTSAASYGK